MTLTLLKIIDEEYTRHPFYGTRKMTAYLKAIGYAVNRKRIQGLYKQLGIEAVYPKINLSKRNMEHKIYPYLLRDITIDRCNQVWSTDITYIRMKEGFVYLMAIIDWHSRYVIEWSLSTTLDADFCVEALVRALEKRKCDIFNTDQGSQFTCIAFTNVLKENEIQISMDGRGRALDNIFVERLWRSVKYECIYLHEYYSVKEVYESLKEYFQFYNQERLHQSLDYKTPGEVYC